MPELPEVEAACKLLRTACVGKRFTDVHVEDDEKVFVGGSTSDFQAALLGQKLVGVGRKGKYFYLELDGNGPSVVMHFGMTGAISVEGAKSVAYKRAHVEANAGGAWPPRFTKLHACMEGGVRLAFMDSRRFARVKLVQGSPLSNEPLSKLGPDTYNEPYPLDEWTAALKTRSARAPALKIKALLLEQEFISGVGNWVGDEVLYHARMHPEQPVASLTSAQAEALHTALNYVITTAVDVDADSARFPRDWLFHYRWTGKKASSLPSGHKIDFVTVGSRTSAFVPVLQRLTGKAAVSDTNDVISIDGETDQEEGSSKASAKDAKAKAKPQGRTKAAVEAKGTATGKGTGRGRGKKVDEEEVDIAKEEGREGEEAPLEDERAGVRKVAAKKAPAAEPSGRKRRTAGAGAAAEADDGVASDAAAGTEVVADSKGHDGPTGDGPDGGGDVLRVDDAPPPAAKKAKASKPAGSKSSARNKGAAAAAAALEADTAIKAEGAVKGTARGRGPAAAVTAQGTEGMEVAAVAGVPALQAAAGRKAAIGRGKKKY